MLTRRQSFSTRAKKINTKKHVPGQAQAAIGVAPPGSMPTASPTAPHETPGYEALALRRGRLARRPSLAPAIPRVGLAGGGLAVFISLFIHWYHVNYYDGYGYAASGGANAWRLFSTLQVFLCLFAVVLVAVAGLDFLRDRQPDRPKSRMSGLPLVALFVGALTALLAFIHLFDMPYSTLVKLDGGSETVTTGVVLALVGGLVATASAVELALRRQSFALVSQGWKQPKGPSNRMELVHSAPDGARSRESAAYLDELERLDELRRNGALTPEEFASAKAAVLESASSQPAS
jgi:hypothetical protein